MHTLINTQQEQESTRYNCSVVVVSIAIMAEVREMIYKGKLEICASKIPPAGKAVSWCLLLCHLSATEAGLKTVNNCNVL